MHLKILLIFKKKLTIEAYCVFVNHQTNYEDLLKRTLASNSDSIKLEEKKGDKSNEKITRDRNAYKLKPNCCQ